MRLAPALFVLSLWACTPKEPVEIGASCGGADKIEACAVGKLALCSGGKWQESMSCPGPNACTRKAGGHGGSAPICDDARGRAGNVCNKGGDDICSEEGHARLRCTGGRWQSQGTCPKRCGWNQSGIVCE